LIYTFESAEVETAFYLADALAEVLKKELEGLEHGVERLQISEEEESSSEQAGFEGVARRIKWKVPKSWETGLMGPELGLESRTELFG
jgi:hypothetical protein